MPHCFSQAQNVSEGRHATGHVRHVRQHQDDRRIDALADCDHHRLPSSLATYAANGAVTAFGGDLFDLDPFGMVQAVHDPTYGVKYWAFVYTADDERIWKYDMGPANTSWWKVRDLGGRS